MLHKPVQSSHSEHLPRSSMHPWSVQRPWPSTCTSSCSTEEGAGQCTSGSSRGEGERRMSLYRKDQPPRCKSRTRLSPCLCRAGCDIRPKRRARNSCMCRGRFGILDRYLFDRSWGRKDSQIQSSDHLRRTCKSAGE
jgi:hypothetical protein